MRLKMKRDKKHFIHFITLLLQFEEKTVANAHLDSSQKLILSLLHQLKHISTDFDDLKVILI